MSFANVFRRFFGGLTREVTRTIPRRTRLMQRTARRHAGATLPYAMAGAGGVAATMAATNYLPALKQTYVATPLYRPVQAVNNEPLTTRQPVLLKNTGPEVGELYRMRAAAQPATIKYYTDMGVSFISYDGQILTPEQAASLSTRHGPTGMPYIAFGEGVSESGMRETLAKYKRLGLI